ncbi:uncharacterized protein [Ptychodera flava]|uniref:uncharacterized protein n=1 Tax=Ptychodera flava TaxID=63121 RepID=UPI00396AADCA
MTIVVGMTSIYNACAYNLDEHCSLGMIGHTEADDTGVSADLYLPYTGVYLNSDDNPDPSLEDENYAQSPSLDDRKIVAMKIPGLSTNERDIEDWRCGTKRKWEEFEKDNQERCAHNATTTQYDRRHIFKISVNKLNQIDDPELFLRRSVLVNNIVKRIQHEIRDETRKPVGNIVKHSVVDDRLPRKRIHYCHHYDNHMTAAPVPYYYMEPDIDEESAKITDDMTERLVNSLTANNNIEETTEKQAKSSTSVAGDLDGVFCNLICSSLNEH